MWIVEEDLETFLKDDTNQERNRIKIIHNLIRPMVEQYRGNSIILNINATAKPVSKKAINRRERALQEQILKTRTANEFPGIGENMRSGDPSIGKNEEETTQIFNNLYVDQYTKTTNMLIRYVKELNEMSEMQVRLAQKLKYELAPACPADFADSDFMPTLCELGAGEVYKIDARNAKDQKRDDNKGINFVDASAGLQIAAVAGIKMNVCDWTKRKL